MENQQQTDEKFMRQALSEARKAFDQQEVPVGAVVVGEGLAREPSRLGI